MAGKRKSGGRSKFWSMKGVHRSTKVPYESGLEKRFLDQCYMMGVKVGRCKVVVPYQDASGKWCQYEPDFLLIEYDYVVEIKGSWAFRDNHGNVREKFFAAQKHFQGRYTLVTEKELKGTFVSELLRTLHNGN